MRKPARNLSVATAALLVAAAPAWAQELTLNRVADGDFESGVVSLTLPASAAFPVFSGGWASRGARAPEIVAGDAFDGALFLRIDTRPQDVLQVIQDLPLNGAAYGLRFAFFIEEGSQTVRLLDDWNRRAPGDAIPAFEARLAATGIRFSTPAGTWQVAAEIAPLVWHSLSVIADPRSGTQSVRLDGRPLLSLPGIPFLRRSTLLLGGDDAERGVFRYDAVELMSLVDLELAAIGTAVEELRVPARAAVLNRLAAAQAALDRGSPLLALPELGVARNMLSRSGAATESLRRAIVELIELVEAGGADGQIRRRIPF